MIFNTKFNISFGYPRTDTCATCDEYTAKIKALSAETDKHQIQQLTTNNILHKKRAECFYNHKKKAKIQARKNKKKEAICIDFAKNVFLPQIATNDVYYKRQLSMYSFNVHVLAPGESIFYVYDESVAKKVPNELASFLFHFIMNYLDDEVQELDIFCDSAGGQNKNYTIFRFIHYFTNNRIHGLTDIKITFPIRGHSYLECDKNVGLWNIKAPMEIPKDFEEMVKLSRSKPSPFTVISVTKRIVLDWKIMLLSQYAAKCPFKTQPIKVIQAFSSHSRLLQYRTTYFGEMLTSIIRAPRHSQSLPKRLFELTSPAYNGLLPISRAKFNDLQSLMKFCSPLLSSSFSIYPMTNLMSGSIWIQPTSCWLFTFFEHNTVVIFINSLLISSHTDFVPFLTLNCVFLSFVNN
ncbi:uncharacterized protein LOC126740503 [Anthonomus grandis grandis]|uniref:uncharacterized protein LOC126740503 n=1 Tax=Anthonomus grandis grandis TaxID=2921223 RepID=UPI0021665DA7|nr:uncharacterized protein LOC126740503 [Anthonomus grandis grandis]